MARFGFRVLLLLLLDVILLGGSLWHTRYVLNRARVPFLLDEVEGTLVIDEVLDPPSAQGLTPGFVVQSIDGIAVGDFHDAELLADLRAVGDTLQVRGLQGGELRSAGVRLIPFYSLRYVVICLLISFITLATAMFVVLARPTDRTARVLHAALACVAFGVMFTWGAAPKGDPWPIISRVAYFTVYIGAATSFLHFTLLFPRRLHELTHGRAILLHIPALLIAIPALLTHLQALLGGSLDSYREFRRYFDLYHSTILVYVTLGVANFIRSYRSTRAPDERKKLQWLLWGMAIGPAPFLLLEILPELFIPLSPIPEEYTLVFLLVIPLSFTVSFVRYRILDIQVVIHRTTVYGIVLGVFVLVYLCTVAAVAAIVGQLTVGASAVSAVIVALAFEPIRRQVQRIVDRYFFRVRYDFRVAERELVEQMKKRSTTIDLARFVVTQVQRIIPAERVAFVMSPPGSPVPVCVAEASSGRVGGQADVFSVLWTRVVEDQLYGTSDEVEPGVPCLPVDAGTMDSAGLALVIPMFSGTGQLLALLALGRKKSGVRFSSEDVDLLRMAARQVGLEIDRIMLQEEVVRNEREAQRLRDLSEIKSSFVSNVSHEFRTPLTSIRLFAELLRGSQAAKDGKSREFLSIIEGEAERLDQMVTTILDSSRIEKGIRTYSMQECDLSRIVRSVLRTMRYQLRKAGFTVRAVGLSTGKRATVHGDAQAIFEVLVNLIGNALKYSGGRRSITIRLRAGAKHVICAVHDRGEGIPADELQHIFEPYYRAPAADKKAEGIGLGLPLVRSIMDAHGGEVKAESVAGKGSSFTLVFPRRAVRRRRRGRVAKPSDTMSTHVSH